MTVLSTRAAGLAAAPAVLAVALIFCAMLALVATVRTRPAPSMSAHAAETFALRDPSVRRQLTPGYDRVRTSPVDNRLVRVSFFEGPRVVLDAAVAPDGRVTNLIPYRDERVRAGSVIAQGPLVLTLLVAVFLLAGLTAPLRSLRNLDVLVLASFTASIVLVNERLFEASVYASYPPLAYLCLRCAYVGFRGRTAGAVRPLVPLRPRTLAVAAGAAGLAFVLLAIPGGLVGDVAFASMAGATNLTHGVLPYGHLTQGELVHGDTYPLLAYAAYVPAALITPVKTAFDQLDGALWAATAFALIAAAAIHRLGGLRLALAWLSFPPVVIAASAGSNDLVAAAVVAWAVALVAYAGRSAAILAIAGWVKVAPFLALPLWIARTRGPSLGRALLAAGAATTAVMGWILVVGGLHGLGDMVDAVSFQAERGSLLSLWTLTGADAAHVAVEAAVATLVVAGAWQVRRDSDLARDPRRVGALAAAVLLGAELSANYWTYAYLPWVFPLVALALLVPVPRLRTTS